MTNMMRLTDVVQERMATQLHSFGTSEISRTPSRQATTSHQGRPLTTTSELRHTLPSHAAAMFRRTDGTDNMQDTSSATTATSPITEQAFLCLTSAPSLRSQMEVVSTRLHG